MGLRNSANPLWAFFLKTTPKERFFLFDYEIVSAIYSSEEITRAATVRKFRTVRQAFIKWSDIQQLKKSKPSDTQIVLLLTWTCWIQ